MAARIFRTQEQKWGRKSKSKTIRRAAGGKKAFEGTISLWFWERGILKKERKGTGGGNALRKLEGKRDIPQARLALLLERREEKYFFPDCVKKNLKWGHNVSPIMTVKRENEGAILLEINGGELHGKKKSRKRLEGGFRLINVCN